MPARPALTCASGCVGPTTLFGMNKQEGQVQAWQVPGAPVQGYVWEAGQPRGAVLLTHGFGEYASRYVTGYSGLIPALTEAGFTVYAYDQRGHGESAGRRAVVDVEDLVADHFRAREALRGLGVPLFAFGHSMGGLVTAASAARDPRGLSGVLLSSPALLVGEDQSPLLKRAAPLLARVLPALPVTELDPAATSRLPEAVQAYRADPRNYHGKVPALSAATMLRTSGALWPDYARWTLPTLVVHGTEDRLADVRGSQRFVQSVASPDLTYHEVAGGFHELLNDEGAAGVRDVLLNWLIQRV